ncbi:hypothetical protein Droror1_Dr00005891 [Drosera rotundifolia]
MLQRKPCAQIDHSGTVPHSSLYQEANLTKLSFRKMPALASDTLPKIPLSLPSDSSLIVALIYSSSKAAFEIWHSSSQLKLISISPRMPQQQPHSAQPRHPYQLLFPFEL